MKRPIKAAIYGESGAGKTTILGTLENPFIAATDENTLALELTGKHYELINDWNDLVACREKLHAMLIEGNCPYTAACIDTLSNTEVKFAKGRLNLNYIPLDRWSKDVIPPWRDEILLWCDFANPKKYEKPIDVIFTARVDFVIAESGTKYGTLQAPGRALGKEVYAWMDEVFYIEEQTGVGPDNKTYSKHVLHTRRYENFVAKDGSRALDAVEEPDFSVIKDKINERLASVKPSQT